MSSPDPKTMTAAQVEALSEPEALAVVAAHLKAKSPALIEALAGSKNKALQKAAKKALYQLKSSGVKVSAPAVPAETMAPAAPEPKDAPPGILSSILGTGERALFFVQPRRGGGLDSYQGIVSDTQGVLQLDRGETNRAAYRRHLKQLHGDNVLEVPTERVFEELCAAWGVTLALKAQLPQGVEPLLRRLGLAPLQSLPPLPPVEPGDEGLSTQGHTLHQQPELQPWLPPEKEIAVLAQRLEEVRASPLQLSQAQRQEQAQQKIALSAREFFVGPMRQLYARRLWKVGELFERTGREQPARIARAEARRLFHLADQLTRFGEQLFEKVMVLSEQAAAHRAAQAGPAAATLPPPQLRPPGGLILP